MATHNEDDLSATQNGDLVSRDDIEDGDLEGEDGDLDDDMMDKISSSPSIDDGGLPCQLPTLSNPQQYVSRCSSPAPNCFSEARSSSPYLDLPDYLPIQQPLKQAAKVPAESPPRHHHLPVAWPDGLDKLDEQPSGNTTARYKGNDTGDIGTSPSREGVYGHDYKGQLYEEDTATMEAEQVTDDNMPRQDSKEEQTGIDEAIDMEDEFDDIEDLIVPYEGSIDEDDDDDLSFESIDPRFVDSGWGGECLHDTEDIDFELVYALHTFIATVEGQANATKGDAMVLLDDSNSYWWLVRVVKDSSIGMLSSKPPGHSSSMANYLKGTCRPSISKHQLKDLPV